MNDTGAEGENNMVIEVVILARLRGFTAKGEKLDQCAFSWR